MLTLRTGAISLASILSLSWCTSAACDGLYINGQVDVSPRPRNIEELARSFDEKGDSNWTPPLNNGFRTTIGAQFDSSCLNMAPQAGALYALNRAMEESVLAIVSCEKRYPELKRYFRQWIASARRHVFKCISNKDIGPQYGGNSDTKGTVQMTQGMLDHIMGIQPDEPTERSPLSNGAGVAFVIHEVLHSTEANSREDHSEIELVPSQTDIVEKMDKTRLVVPAGCKDDITGDRINMIASLCTGFKPDKWDRHALDLFGLRMAACGQELGCAKGFTRRERIRSPDTNPNSFMPSKGLNSDSASSLCLRIRDDAHCLYVRSTAGKNLTRSLPEVRSVREKLQERFLKVLPRTENHIPGALLALYPKLKAELDVFRDSPCFRSIFTVAPDGSLFVRSPGSKRHEDPLNRFMGPGKDSLTSFLTDGIQAKIWKATNLRKMCLGDTYEPARITKTIRELAWQVNELESSTFLWKNPLRFASGDLEAMEKFGEEGWPAPLPLDFHPDAKLLFGEELLATYAAVVKRYHWLSPGFDCAATGLRPYHATTKASETLARLPKEAPSALSCPQ